MAELELKDIKDMFDRDYTHNQTTRRKAADDRIFAYVTQWDSELLEDSQLAYRGEFNIIRKATRQIKGDLYAHQVQIDFEPKADTRTDGAEIIDGLYLSDDRRNSSIEAYDNASTETIDCGIGGWELYTEYESNRAGDKKQVIRRRPIYEFNNNAFPDSNAKLMDKSDSKRWTILEPYSLDGYKELHKELTGEETKGAPADFAAPEQSYVFPWLDTNETYYIARFYHKTQVKDKVLTLTNDYGDSMRLLESDLNDVMDELIDDGYQIVDEKKIKRWQIKLYIVSGERILKTYDIAGEHIPVIPMYGERAFVEGEEHYEGVIRLAKDPQRLRNFLMSYLGEMAARSPREKPIFTAEQIAGYEHMYELSGAENNFPYVLQHLHDPDGNPLPAGPIGTLTAPQMPQVLPTLIDLTRQAVEDVANPGLPQDIADPSLSGKAVELLQNRLDQQSFVYQNNLKHAKRYDAEVWASMATEVFDSPRSVTITLPDGSRKQEQIMSTVIDEETGDPVILNDLTNMEFDVYAKLGPTYTSMKDKTREELADMADQVREADPALHAALVYKRLQLLDGSNMDDIREYVNKQMMLRGFKKPETDEEKQFMEQSAQQQEEPSAEMVLAQAEQMKGKAALMEQERRAMVDQAEIQNKQGKLSVDAFQAETQRGKVEVDAAKAGVDVEMKRVQIEGHRIDNVMKMTEPFRARVNA
tara:strand:+ start:819 stop:2918 length:2100 start_codon:yes stop_codon:yes gene_type:complete